MQRILIHTDGGARGNPGPAGIGAVIVGEDGAVIRELSEYIGETTNNVAEYQPLIRALEETKKIFGEKSKDLRIEVMMDSELVVRQLAGVYKVKEPTLKELFARVATLRLEAMPNIIFTHVRREKNAHADQLVNKAIDAAQR